MYCPSCDKSYGAVHSRCPECHSWLKVSAPANSRAKSARVASAVSVGSVSTLDKEPAAWTEPPASGGGDWGQGVSDSWSDALPAPAASPIPASLSTDPAPVADAWGGGSAWGGASSDSWGGGMDPATAKLPSAPLASPVSSPPLAPVSPSPAPVNGGAWLSGGGDDDGWGGSSGGFKAPAAPAAVPPLSLGTSSDDGWGGGSGTLGSAPPVPAGGLSGHAPVPGPAPDTEGDGWGGSSSSTFGGANGTSKSSSVAKSVPAPGQGWLGGDAAGAVDEEESATGWLGDSRTTKVGAPASDGDGWLGGEAKAKGPSMTEMVDRAIGVEEADDFVDDSWVDEEVGNGEFDDIEGPEYVPPTPEVGGAFLKMLLVAVVVLFIGGGVMFLGQEKKTPEQIKAEERVKELEFARSSVQTGKNYLKEGKGLLAIGPLEAAMTSLKTSGGSEKEILDTKATLARALMKAQEYQKSHDHWAALAKGSSEYKKEAKGQMAEASKLLRAQATDQLVEAAGYIKNGESSSVVDLGQSALKIFEKHSGTASQKGKAYGVIGRGYANGKEYGKAKDHLRKARELNPAGGYDADLRQIAAASAPVNYYGSGGYSGSNPAPAQPAVITVKASIGSEPGYQTRVGGGGGGGYRPPPPPSPASGSANTAPAPAKTREIPAYQRPARSSGSGGGRKGQQGVVPTY